MWKPEDEFWLGLTGNNDESSLLVALGRKPLRITATEPDTWNNREGYIDVNIVGFLRQTGMLRVSVVENTTDLRFKRQTLELVLDADVESDTCKIHEIHTLIFD